MRTSQTKVMSNAGKHLAAERSRLNNPTVTHTGCPRPPGEAARLWEGDPERPARLQALHQEDGRAAELFHWPEPNVKHITFRRQAAYY